MMFELFVLACLISNPQQCLTLQDLYSPHATHDKCLARAYVIAREMKEYMPHYFAKSYKCFDMRNADKIET
jgi:hypothetical protein